jgi:hypothetical protein
MFGGRCIPCSGFQLPLDPVDTLLLISEASYFIYIKLLNFKLSFKSSLVSGRYLVTHLAHCEQIPINVVNRAYEEG